MYQILLPVDRNVERAYHQAQYVRRLASDGTEIAATVLYVVPPSEFTRADRVEFDDVDAAVEAAETLEAAGVSVDRSVDDGGVGNTIVETADDLDADEIVMGGRRRSGVTQVLLGSTVQDVALSADRPVTVTGANVVFGTGDLSMLVPVDRNVERARHQASFVTDLPTAPEGVSATVCYVFPHQDYQGAPDHEFEEVEAAVAAADQLEAAGVSVDRVSVGGEVARKILDMAEDRDVDGVVMGGRKRSGVQKVLMGSTTLDVVLSAKRPVTITG